MKKIALLVLLLSCVISVNALDISFLSQKFDEKTYLIIKCEADNDKLISNPFIIKFFLNDGTIFRLENSTSTKYEKRSSIPFGGSSSQDNSDSYYKFEVTEEMKTAFKKGIKGVVINTIPKICKIKFNEKESNKIFETITNPQETDNLE